MIESVRLPSMPPVPSRLRSAADSPRPAVAADEEDVPALAVRRAFAVGVASTRSTAVHDAAGPDLGDDPHQHEGQDGQQDPSGRTRPRAPWPSAPWSGAWPTRAGWATACGVGRAGSPAGRPGASGRGHDPRPALGARGGSGARGVVPVAAAPGGASGARSLRDRPGVTGAEDRARPTGCAGFLGPAAAGVERQGVVCVGLLLGPTVPAASLRGVAATAVWGLGHGGQGMPSSRERERRLARPGSPRRPRPRYWSGDRADPRARDPPRPPGSPVPARGRRSRSSSPCSTRSGTCRRRGSGARPGLPRAARGGARSGSLDGRHRPGRCRARDGGRPGPDCAEPRRAGRRAPSTRPSPVRRARSSPGSTATPRSPRTTSGRRWRPSSRTTRTTSAGSWTRRGRRRSSARWPRAMRSPLGVGNARFHVGGEALERRRRSTSGCSAGAPSSGWAATTSTSPEPRTGR